MFGFGQKINVAAINDELKENRAYIVDVREDEEWDELHVKDALHLSVDRIMNGEVPTKDMSKKLYLYCVSGARASAAAMKLRASGYTVENLGGISSWQSAGGATVSGM